VIAARSMPSAGGSQGGHRHRRSRRWSTQDGHVVLDVCSNPSRSVQRVPASSISADGTEEDRQGPSNTPSWSSKGDALFIVGGQPQVVEGGSHLRDPHFRGTGYVVSVRPVASTISHRSERLRLGPLSSTAVRITSSMPSWLSRRQLQPVVETVQGERSMKLEEWRLLHSTFIRQRSIVVHAPSRVVALRKAVGPRGSIVCHRWRCPERRCRLTRRMQPLFRDVTDPYPALGRRTSTLCARCGPSPRGKPDGRTDEANIITRQWQEWAAILAVTTEVAGISRQEFGTCPNQMDLRYYVVWGDPVGLHSAYMPPSFRPTTAALIAERLAAN